MKVAILTTDNREHYREYSNPRPYFGMAPEALLQGFAGLPGVELHVVSCARRPMVSPEKLAENIWFHSLVVPKIGWMRTLYWGCIRAVRRKLREIQPDIVHGQGTERDCAMAAVFSGHPNVVTLHGNMVEMERVYRASPRLFHQLTAVLENLALRRTVGVFCNSRHTEASVKPRAHRTWAVPNAVREMVFSQPVNRFVTARAVLLNVGVVCTYKRQIELLAVARALRAAGHDLELHFLGQANASDPYAREFLNQVGSAAMRDYVFFDGFKGLHSLIEIYDRASAMVHVPSAEAFGLVVAEALGRNLKFFGTETGGIPDIARGADGAELFAVNDWEGMTTAIGQWLRRGHVRPGAAAPLMQERYHPAVVARRHLEIYREVLSTLS